MISKDQEENLSKKYWYSCFWYGCRGMDISHL